MELGNVLPFGEQFEIVFEFEIVLGDWFIVYAGWFHSHLDADHHVYYHVPVFVAQVDETWSVLSFNRFYFLQVYSGFFNRRILNVESGFLWI